MNIFNKKAPKEPAIETAKETPKEVKKEETSKEKAKRLKREREKAEIEAIIDEATSVATELKESHRLKFLADKMGEKYPDGVKELKAAVSKVFGG